MVSNAFERYDEMNREMKRTYSKQSRKTFDLINEKRTKEQFWLLSNLNNTFSDISSPVDKFDKRQTKQLGMEINKIADELPGKLKVIARNIKKTASMM